jgi:tetratricopeptide (TPR) repeat protein
MGMIAVEEQLWADGKSMLQDALERYQDIGLWGNVYVVLNALGEIARATEDYKEAEKYYLENLELVREQEIAIDIAIGLFNLAQNELMLGDTRQALIHISEGYAQARPLGDEIIMLFLEANANLFASQGRPYDAALLWGAVEAVCEIFNVHLDTADKLQREHFYAIARSKSEESRFQKAWLRGRHFSLEQAVEFAQHMISSNKEVSW